jgi:hypothetical protein
MYIVQETLGYRFRITIDEAVPFNYNAQGSGAKVLYSEI